MYVFKQGIRMYDEEVLGIKIIIMQSPPHECDADWWQYRVDYI